MQTPPTMATLFRRSAMSSVAGDRVDSRTKEVRVIERDVGRSTGSDAQNKDATDQSAALSGQVVLLPPNATGESAKAIYVLSFR